MNYLNAWVFNCTTVILSAGEFFGPSTEEECSLATGSYRTAQIQIVVAEEQMVQKYRSTSWKLPEDFSKREEIGGTVLELAAVSTAWMGLGFAAPAPSLTTGKAVYSSDSSELKVDLRGRNLPTEVVLLYDDVTASCWSPAISATGCKPASKSEERPLVL